MGFPTTYVNVELLIHVVARLGPADTITPELPRLLGRPPRTLAHYIHDNRAMWIGT